MNFKFNKKLILIIVFLLSVSVLLYGCKTDIGKGNNDTKDEINKNKDNDKPKEVPVRKEKVSLLATGDVMFHNSQLAGAKQSDGSYDFNNYFQFVKKYIEEVDIALANFETTTLDSKPPTANKLMFNTPKSSIEALKNAGFDILATANNHTLDTGKSGIINTIDNINEYGLKSFGTYKEPSSRVLIDTVNDVKIAFISYTYGCNGLESRLTREELSYMVNIIDEDKIKSDIEEAEEKGADATVVFIHWGAEYDRNMNTKSAEYQTELGHKMVDWGADIIFGSHPHVIQKSEIIEHEGEDKFIIYSMGNFVSNQRRETLAPYNIKNRIYTEDGVMVKLEIEKDFSTNKTIITTVDYIPTWVHKYKKAGKDNYEILPIESYIAGNENDIGDSLLAKLKKSQKNTLDLMTSK